MDRSLERQVQKQGLLYSKCAIRGEAVELILECIHVDDYRGDACHLKHAIDDVILT